MRPKLRWFGCGLVWTRHNTRIAIVILSVWLHVSSRLNSKWDKPRFFFVTFSVALKIEWEQFIYFIILALCCLSELLEWVQGTVYRFLSIHNTSTNDYGQDVGRVSPTWLASLERSRSGWVSQSRILFVTQLTPTKPIMNCGLNRF